MTTRQPDTGQPDTRQWDKRTTGLPDDQKNRQPDNWSTGKPASDLKEHMNEKIKHTNTSVTSVNTVHHMRVI